MELKQIKKEVLEILINEPKARSNDKYLIYRVLENMGLPTDLQDLINTDISFETITRARRKWQEKYIYLAATNETQEMRQKLYDQIKADALGIEV